MTDPLPPKIVCANCDREIGHLEQAHLWRGHTICSDCLRRLSPHSSPTTDHQPLTSPNPQPPTPAPCDPPVQTIEATGKFWKQGQLVGGGAAILGVILAVLSVKGYYAGDAAPALILLGLSVYIAARVAAWWHHG